MHVMDGSPGQGVQTGPKVTTVAGSSNVRLSCIPPPNVTITMINWKKDNWQGDPQERRNIAVFSPNFGLSFPNGPYKNRVNFSSRTVKDDASLILSRVKPGDEGVFICEVSTFPHGNFEGKVTLDVLVKPQVFLNLTTDLREGNVSTMVAVCEARGGRPKPIVVWEDLGPAFNMTEGRENRSRIGETWNVLRELWTIPERSSNRQAVGCTVKHPAFVGQLLKLTEALSIVFPPVITAITGYDHNWFLGRSHVSLKCHVDSNPPSTIRWIRINGPLPKGHILVEQQLQLDLPLLLEHAGTYVCTASNGLGHARKEVTVVIADKPLHTRTSPGGVWVLLGGVAAILLIIAFVVTTAIVCCRLRTRHKPAEHISDGDLNTKFPNTQPSASSPHVPDISAPLNIEPDVTGQKPSKLTPYYDTDGTNGESWGPLDEDKDKRNCSSLQQQYQTTASRPYISPSAHYV
uniref:nectin-3-like isoform X2 n=1 Tax=Myxine glutinosa TaxID=7769 RepID=UPI00358E9CF7